MAATPYQRRILEMLAARISRDIDLFHDTKEAVAATCAVDKELLTAGGYSVEVLREAPAYMEALVSSGPDRVVLQWAQDSAFRFFPLVEDGLMGLALHPFDLATNKVLAMAGRMEPRDWIDLLNCDAVIQPLGYLVWAACGKDPGYNPVSLIAEISRAHYSQTELNMLHFSESSPDAAALGKRWHEILHDARTVCAQLPASELGKCVVTDKGELFRGGAAEVARALTQNTLRFHAGRLGGSWPAIVE